MDTYASATATFDAGHQIKNIVACWRKHGHFYTVTATVAGEIDEAGWPRGTIEIVADVRKIASELDGRNLDEMLPGVITTPLGIALWFVEQLAGRYPSLVEIVVECSDHTAGRVTRTPR